MKASFRCDLAAKCNTMRITLANTFFTRLRGLIGRRRILNDEGLLLTPCNQVHTWFMRFAIDAVFLDKDQQVVRVLTLRPWRISPRLRRATMCLELAAGRARALGITEGASLPFSLFLP